MCRSESCEVGRWGGMVVQQRRLRVWVGEWAGGGGH